MAATVRLSSEELAVAPGETGRCELIITNTGSLVDQFSIGLVGAPRDWVKIEPSTLNLMPGASGTAVVVFAPPRSSEVVAGKHAFGVRVGSREEPSASVVEEGSVEVESFREIVAELVPVKRRVRRRATFRLAVDNLGNSETQVELALRDPEDELRLETAEPAVITAPGTATIVKIRAVPHRRFLRGQPKTLPFEVIATPVGDQPIKVGGVVQQVQLIPQWLLPAVAALVVLVVALAGVWYALLKPAVKSIATEQTEQQVARAESAASKATVAAEKAGAAATVAQKAAGLTPSPEDGASPASSSPTPGAGTPSTGTPKPGAGTPAPGAGTPKPGAGTAPPTGPLPVSFRVATTAKVVTDGSFTPFSYSAPPEKSLNIADLVLQNPRGDTGILRISIGKNIVLETGLGNFRDLDYHYLEPLRAEAGQAVVVSVSCTAPGAGFDRCTPSVSFSGKLA